MIFSVFICTYISDVQLSVSLQSQEGDTRLAADRSFPPQPCPGKLAPSLDVISDKLSAALQGTVVRYF
jgi:hypothetical protein